MTDPFKIRDHVLDAQAISDDYTLRSDRARRDIRGEFDIAYGDHPDERLDLFFPRDMEGRAPVHIFIHGGYWRAGKKEDYAFIAEPVVAAGAIAAIVEYSLMPNVRMAKLVDQVRRAAAWVNQHAETFGGDTENLSASGLSAGAHLVFYLGARGPREAAFPETPIRSLLLGSGIYDLAPIAHSFLQPEIGLIPDEIAAWSPIDAILKPGVAIRPIVGADETAPFHDQAALLARRNGLAVHTLDGLNHMTIGRALGTPGTEAAALLGTTILHP
jgi:arylformamidase